MFKKRIIEIIHKIVPEIENFSVSFQEKNQEKFGHYATNIALLLAGKNKKNPIELAEEIAHKLREKNDFFSRIEIAIPGFINIWLQPTILTEVISSVLSSRNLYGKNEIGKNKKIRIEYVSANPTGPLHIGNARGGPIGNTLSNIFELSGYSVLREYIHNDIGNQVEKMTLTVLYWYEKKLGKEVVFPEGGYPGEYLSEVAEALLIKKGKDLSEKNLNEITTFALDYIYKENIDTLSRLGIHFDLVVKESEFITSGKTDAAIEFLLKKQVIKERDGALWFSPNDEFLEDRETVVRRSNNKPTYFASDIAYHREKFTSGYDMVIDIFGSNHDGHVPKLKALSSFFGFSSENFFVLLYQYVRIKKGNEVMRMAKRAGTYITAKEVLDEVGADNIIFSFLSNSPSTHIDFDLELVKKQSMQNPVYYVQYALVRAQSILEKAKEIGTEIESLASFSNLTTEEDIYLLRKIAQYPEIIEETLLDFELQRVTRYITDLARAFHTFYEKERIVGEEIGIARERYYLVSAIIQIFKNTFSVIGISTPEKM